MATPQSTRRPKDRPTTLSQRITNGNKPTFRPTHSVWTSWQDPEPHIAFRVSWGEADELNHFAEYACLILLTEDIKPGDLAYGVTASGHHLVDVQDDGGFLDATSKQSVPPERIVIRGRVVCESESLSRAQLDGR